MAPQSQTPLVLRTLLYSLAHPLALYSSHSRLAPNRTDIDQLFPSQKELELGYKPFLLIPYASSSDFLVLRPPVCS